jgi:hypothetical protein
MTGPFCRVSSDAHKKIKGRLLKILKGRHGLISELLGIKRNIRALFK